MTTEEMNALDIITVNELDEVLFDNVYDLMKSDLNDKEKILYLNRLTSFVSINDNVLSELYGIFKTMDEDAVMTIENGKVKFKVNNVFGVLTSARGIEVAK